MNKTNGEIDIPATKVELEFGISSNLWMVSLAPGLVPIYEEQVTRIERGIDLDKWSKISADEKAMMVAVRRTGIAMQNLQSEAEIRQIKKK